MPLIIPEKLTVSEVQSVFNEYKLWLSDTTKKELISHFVPWKATEMPTVDTDDSDNTPKVTIEQLRQAFFIAALHRDKNGSGYATSLGDLVERYNEKIAKEAKINKITNEKALAFIFTGDIPDKISQEDINFYTFICKNNYLLRRILLDSDGSREKKTRLLDKKPKYFPQIADIDNGIKQQRFGALQTLYKAIGSQDKYYTSDNIDLLAKLPNDTLKSPEFITFLSPLLTNNNLAETSAASFNNSIVSSVNNQKMKPTQEEIKQTKTNINKFFLDPEVINNHGIALFNLTQQLTGNIILPNKKKLLDLSVINNPKGAETVKKIAQSVVDIACQNTGIIDKKITDSMSEIIKFLNKHADFAKSLKFPDPNNITDAQLRKFAYTGDPQSEGYHDDFLKEYYKKDSTIRFKKKEGQAQQMFPEIQSIEVSENQILERNEVAPFLNQSTLLLQKENSDIIERTPEVLGQINQFYQLELLTNDSSDDEKKAFINVAEQLHAPGEKTLFRPHYNEISKKLIKVAAKNSDFNGLLPFINTLQSPESTQKWVLELSSEKDKPDLEIFKQLKRIAENLTDDQNKTLLQAIQNNKNHKQDIINWLLSKNDGLHFTNVDEDTKAFHLNLLTLCTKIKDFELLTQTSSYNHDQCKKLIASLANTEHDLTSHYTDLVKAMLDKAVNNPTIYNDYPDINTLLHHSASYITKSPYKDKITAYIKELKQPLSAEHFTSGHFSCYCLLQEISNEGKKTQLQNALLEKSLSDFNKSTCMQEIAQAVCQHQDTTSPSKPTKSATGICSTLNQNTDLKQHLTGLTDEITSSQLQAFAITGDWQAYQKYHPVFLNQYFAKDSKIQYKDDKKTKREQEALDAINVLYCYGIIKSPKEINEKLLQAPYLAFLSSLSSNQLYNETKDCNTKNPNEGSSNLKYNITKNILTIVQSINQNSKSDNLLTQEATQNIKKLIPKSDKGKPEESSFLLSQMPQDNPTLVNQALEYLKQAKDNHQTIASLLIELSNNNESLQKALSLFLALDLKDRHTTLLTQDNNLDTKLIKRLATLQDTK